MVDVRLEAALTCEDEDHELEIFEEGDAFDLMKCKKCGQLGTEWK